MLKGNQSKGVTINVLSFCRAGLVSSICILVVFAFRMPPKLYALISFSICVCFTEASLCFYFAHRIKRIVNWLLAVSILVLVMSVLFHYGSVQLTGGSSSHCDPDSMTKFWLIAMKGGLEFGILAFVARRYLDMTWEWEEIKLDEILLIAVLTLPSLLIPLPWAKYFAA